jgi:hypothetical protein
MAVFQRKNHRFIRLWPGLVPHGTSCGWPALLLYHQLCHLNLIGLVLQSAEPFLMTSSPLVLMKHSSLRVDFASFGDASSDSALCSVVPPPLNGCVNVLVDRSSPCQAGRLVAKSIHAGRLAPLPGRRTPCVHGRPRHAFIPRLSAHLRSVKQRECRRLQRRSSLVASERDFRRFNQGSVFSHIFCFCA